MRAKASLGTLVLLVASLCLGEVSVAGQRRKPQVDRVACSIEGQTYFPFGWYDPFAPNDLDVQTQISYRCYEVDDQGTDVSVEDTSGCQGLNSKAERRDCAEPGICWYLRPQNAGGQ